MSTTPTVSTARLLPLLITLTLTLGACTGAKISGSGSSPIIMNQPGAQVDVVERVTESKRKVFDFTGAIDISEVVGETLVGSDADALINTQIAIKSTVPDFFINLFTLGIANAYTVEVTGELVRAPEGLSTLIEEGTVLGRAPTLDDLTLDAEAVGAAGRDAVLVRHDGAYLLVQPGR